MTRLVLFQLFVKNNEKLLVSWQFSGPYGVTKYGSGWWKDVVNQCLEFGARHVLRTQAASSFITARNDNPQLREGTTAARVPHDVIMTKTTYHCPACRLWRWCPGYARFWTSGIPLTSSVQTSYSYCKVISDIEVLFLIVLARISCKRVGENSVYLCISVCISVCLPVSHMSVLWVMICLSAYLHAGPTNTIQYCRRKSD